MEFHSDQCVVEYEERNTGKKQLMVKIEKAEIKNKPMKTDADSESAAAGKQNIGLDKLYVPGVPIFVVVVVVLYCLIH